MALASFFASTKNGPMSLASFCGKPKVFQAECDQVYAAWEEGKLKGEVGLTPTEKVAEALKEHKKAKAQASMGIARQRANEAMKAKKARLTISLK